MKKESLSKRIANYIKKRDNWVSGGEIERLAEKAGYKASNASRRCREMESGMLSDGRTCNQLLDKKMMSGTVFYKYKVGSEPKKPKIVIMNGIAYIQ